jgi:hypothetical protein
MSSSDDTLTRLAPKGLAPERRGLQLSLVETKSDEAKIALALDQQQD